MGRICFKWQMVSVGTLIQRYRGNYAAPFDLSILTFHLSCLGREDFEIFFAQAAENAVRLGADHVARQRVPDFLGEILVLESSPFAAVVLEHPPYQIAPS